MTTTQPAMTAREQLDQLDALREAGTPGQWVHNPRNGVHTPVGSCIASTHRHDDDERQADAALIVAAVNALPQLTTALQAVLELADALDIDAAEAAVEAESDNLAPEEMAQKMGQSEGLKSAAIALRAITTGALQ